jgi:hypothetical protein
MFYCGCTLGHLAGYLVVKLGFDSYQLLRLGWTPAGVTSSSLNVLQAGQKSALCRIHLLKLSFLLSVAGQTL